MPFVPPVPLIRRNLMIRKLKKANATDESRAVTFEQAGIANPNGFPIITERMLKSGILAMTADGKYDLKSF